jgi:putative nucleotidyltransferase with HDIG domain
LLEPPSGVLKPPLVTADTGPEDDVSAPAATRASHGWALHRSLTLLRVFLIASAGILLVTALVMTWVLTTTLKRQALVDSRTSLTQYVDGVLRSQLVRDNRLHVSPTLPAEITAQLRRDSDLVTVKVWRPDGVLAWTNRAPQRIGRRFELEDDLGEALRENRAIASMDNLHSDENEVERSLHYSHLLQVYAPLRSEDGRHVLGAYEIYANPRHTESFIATRKHMIWLTVALVFAALYFALGLLVRGASAMLTRQARILRARSQELVESYRRLQERSLEAIASLNATVDARDPYTAGHSARVQRIALAVADELGLARERLEAVRYGSLFHDIGKIAVPDAILSKPSSLTSREFEVIQRHPADGADIVSKLGSLRDAVPLIRHHHERWDGCGYPDGLSADAIPAEACIIGLADAWDAMTSDRPYRLALSIEAAAAEVHAGRGKQFAPSVVDAFFAALRRQPAAFEVSHTLDAAAASG